MSALPLGSDDRMCRPVFLFVATALRARASGCPCGGALELGPKRLGKIERTTEPRCDGAADYQAGTPVKEVLSVQCSVFSTRKPERVAFTNTELNSEY